MNDELIKPAKVLLENTKRVRLFKGQVYDQDADDYLVQLHNFLLDIINKENPNG